MLLACGYSVDLIPDWKISQVAGRYPIILLPDWKDIGSEVAHAVTDYASGGGRLMICGAENAQLVSNALGLKFAAEPADQDYMNRVLKAAPPQIVNAATVVRMNGSSMQTLRKGTNEWTCMEGNGVPMCMDPNAMEWANAWQSHGPATEKTGFIYMLAGDTGGSKSHLCEPVEVRCKRAFWSPRNSEPAGL